MKRTVFSVLVLCGLLVSTAWAQQASGPRFGRRIHRPGPWNTLQQTTVPMSNSSISTRTTQSQNATIVNLGKYPGGTWAETNAINDFGIAAGVGDLPDGSTHPLAVQVFGRHGPKWFDLGTLGGELDPYAEPALYMGVSNTGLVVGHSATEGGYVHGFVWTQKSGIIDLPPLSGHSYSYAWAANKIGTLIVGWSGGSYWGADTVPVVWTPCVVWRKGMAMTTWKIQALDIKGFERFSAWFALGVNNLGQITGSATGDSGEQIGVLWNPLPRGKGWKIMRLPTSPEFPNAIAGPINDRGEIAAEVDSVDYSVFMPAVWKPAGPKRTYGPPTMLKAVPDAQAPLGFAEGLNEQGDIVGVVMNVDPFTYLAARWKAADPEFVELLPLPGYWNWAVQVNNLGIAVGGYWSDECPGECGVAIKIR